MGDIGPKIIEALTTSNEEWVGAEEFNLEALRRKAQRVDEFDHYRIEKSILQEPDDWTKLAIELKVAFLSSVRLDRLLASELNISRAAVRKLSDEGMLHATAESPDALRRRVRTGTSVIIDLSNEPNRDRLLSPPATDRPL